MTTVRRTALVPYTPAEMFALVTDIESYPGFLPWCRSTRILSRDGDEVRAEVEFAAGAVHKSFTTRNRNLEHEKIAISLVEGPFKNLEGFWQFDSIGERGCRITLDLEFDFAGRLLSLVVGPVFTQIANTLVDSFQRRAREVYGKR